MDHLHRANTLEFPFSQQTVGAGWHMFLPLAIALHTLDRHKWIQHWEKSPTASEPAHLLRKQLQNTLCKVVFKFGVDISDPIPHLNTKDGAKKNKMSSWGESCPLCSHAAYAPVQRHPETCCHFIEIQRRFTNNTNSRSHSETLKLYKWSGCVGTWRRSSPVLIWSKFFSKPILGKSRPAYRTVRVITGMP